MKQSQVDTAGHPDRGYDIDELRYRRAYVLAKCEMAKIQISDQLSNFKNGVKQPAGIMGKLLNSLSYIDYALIAFRLGQRFFKWRKRRGNK